MWTSRAGDAGRGFAVVADEVRSLAIRASEASRNTARLIEESVAKAETGVNLNESVKLRLDEIRLGVQGAAASMNEIAEGAAAQEKELAEVTAPMQQIGGLTQRTAANAERSASAAAELSAQAREMHDLAVQFNVGDGTVATTHVVATRGAATTISMASLATTHAATWRAKSVSPVSIGAGKPAVRKDGTREPGGASPPTKSRNGSPHRSAAKASASAAAMIPFDDDDAASGDDVLRSF